MNEKFCLSFFGWLLLCAVGLFAAGCGSINPFHSMPSQPTAGTISSGGKLIPDEKVTITNLSTVQKVVNYERDLMIWAGVFCLLAAGALAYFQMYFMAIKVGLAGLVLPIFAIWFSHFWGWVVAAAMTSIAVVAWIHWKVVLQPIVKAAASDIQLLASKTANVAGTVKTEIQKKI